MRKEILLTFCGNKSRDPVAHHVWKAFLDMFAPSPCPDRRIEGIPVLTLQTPRGNQIYLAETSDVISHDYARFQDDINRDFGNADLIVVANWHEGNNAPDKILCAHTTADVQSGVFGPASASYLTAVLKALDECRIQAGLNDWRVLFEASHWSGMVHGGKPDDILAIKPPVIDVEIGSQPAEWNNPAAHKVMAAGLGKFADLDYRHLPSLLCFGGVHFEPAFSQAVFAMDTACIQVSHHLPNHWMVSGGYDRPDGADRIMRATRSVNGSIHGFTFHDGLKGPFKSILREAGMRLNIPVFSHKKLRNPDFMRTTFSTFCKSDVGTQRSA